MAWCAEHGNPDIVCSHLHGPKPGLDHTNRPVPPGETRETVIKVWEVSPDPAGRFDHILIRGWQDMLDFLRDGAERALENMDDDELADGLTLKVRLRDMTRGEYEDLQDD